MQVGFSYDTRIVCKPHDLIRIGHFVNSNRTECLAYDLQTKSNKLALVNKNNSNYDLNHFYKILVEKHFGNGQLTLKAKPNQKIYTNNGLKEVKDILPTDKLLEEEIHYLSTVQIHIIEEMLLGDGCLTSHKRHNQSLKFGHCEKQISFLKWKNKFFNNIASSSYYETTNKRNYLHTDYSPLSELSIIKYSFYNRNTHKKMFSYKFLNTLTPLGLAIYLMDDGSIKIRHNKIKEATGDTSFVFKAMSPQSRINLISVLKNKFNILTKIHYAGEEPVLYFDSLATDKLDNLVKEFVIPSMQYKLIPKYRGYYNQAKVDAILDKCFVEPYTVLVPASIRSIEEVNTTHKGSFWLNTETNNYFVNHILVYND